MSYFIIPKIPPETQLDSSTTGWPPYQLLYNPSCRYIHQKLSSTKFKSTKSKVCWLYAGCRCRIFQPINGATDIADIGSLRHPRLFPGAKSKAVLGLAHLLRKILDVTGRTGYVIEYPPVSSNTAGSWLENPRTSDLEGCFHSCHLWLPEGIHSSWMLMGFYQFYPIPPIPNTSFLLGFQVCDLQSPTIQTMVYGVCLVWRGAWITVVRLCPIFRVEKTLAKIPVRKSWCAFHKAKRQRCEVQVMSMSPHVCFGWIHQVWPFDPCQYHPISSNIIQSPISSKWLMNLCQNSAEIPWHEPIFEMKCIRTAIKWWGCWFFSVFFLCSLSF